MSRSCWNGASGTLGRTAQAFRVKTRGARVGSTALVSGFSSPAPRSSPLRHVMLFQHEDTGSVVLPRRRHCAGRIPQPGEKLSSFPLEAAALPDGPRSMHLRGRLRSTRNATRTGGRQVPMPGVRVAAAVAVPQEQGQKSLAIGQYPRHQIPPGMRPRSPGRPLEARRWKRMRGSMSLTVDRQRNGG